MRRRQFGNMLVLLATFMSPFQELVARDRLDERLIRTIDFLWNYRNISPSLKQDAEILRSIQQRVFGDGMPTSISSYSTNPI